MKDKNTPRQAPDPALGALDRALGWMFREALRFSMGSPRHFAFILRTVFAQARAARVRGVWRKKGYTVPAFLIASITRRCNLACAGCYSRAQDPGAKVEVTDEKWNSLLDEARALGVSIVMLAGGEPFARRNVLDWTARRRGMIFPLFTNGLCLEEKDFAALRRQPHVIPVLSIEGGMEQTDRRRGVGVHGKLGAVMDRLKKEGVYFGVSITVTRDNFKNITDDAFVGGLKKSGARVFFYVEYVPVEAGTESLVPSAGERRSVRAAMARLKETHKRLFFAFPAGEEAFGGCLSAGRGFAHISPEGFLEPCPFAPFSDADLSRMTLADALRTKLMRNVRDAVHGSHEGLAETAGGCALFAKKDWLRSLIGEGRE